jgi:hypothetical protein
VFDALEQRLSSGSCYRGRVLSLEQNYAHTGMASRICVHPMESVDRDDVILPEATLVAVERNVLSFAEQRSALRAMGMSTQKGLLFHGAPGTGKHTASATLLLNSPATRRSSSPPRVSACWPSTWRSLACCSLRWW